MDSSTESDLVERERLVRELQSICSATAAERADRYLRVKHHGIVAATPFAAASAESIELFRDGHFYGAISLSQAVGEALVRHMCHSNGFKPAKAFEQNVEALRRRHFLDAATRAQFLGLWKKRDDYHHLNAAIETDRATLERLAFSKLRALAEAEAWVFHWSPGETPGTLAVRFPQYWPKPEKGRFSVFLRHPKI